MPNRCGGAVDGPTPNEPVVLRKGEYVINARAAYVPLSEVIKQARRMKPQ